MSEDSAGEGTDPSESAQRGWFARWRLPLLVAIAVVAVAATVTTVVIQHRGGSQTAAVPTAGADDGAGFDDGATGGGGLPAACDIAPDQVPQFTAPGASWVKDYGSLYALAGDSTNIVIATTTGDRREEPLPEGAANPNVPDTAPNTYATLAVDRVLSGQDITVGQDVEVFAPGEDTDGCPLYGVPGQYLLFLAPYTLGEDTSSWTGEYIAISSYAGVYFHVPASPDGVFARTFQDFESLPEQVDVDGLMLMAGWYDAAYLDHAAAGMDPITLPPLNHPAGTVASPIVGGPADPFSCNGAQTEVAASPDEGGGPGTLFGIAGTRFCVSISGDEGPVTRSELIVAPPLLHAQMRIGSGWDSQFAGLVDGSITTVRAIRGVDDAVHPDDLIPDWEVPLTPLGDMFAFVTDQFTRAVVGYAGGVEQFRYLIWPEFTEEPTGGWGDDLELYDQRDDLDDLRPEALQAWTQIAPDTIRVFFIAGRSGCYAAVVTTQENDTQVRVAVETGWKPETEACEDIAVGAAVDIRLAAPLGDRTVAPLDLG